MLTEQIKLPIKAFLETCSVKFLHHVQDEEIQQWINSKSIFFILAIGRSGTTFFSSLLNQSETAHVVHEPLSRDYLEYRSSFKQSYSRHLYIKYFRIKEIYLRGRHKNFSVYGEVNGNLRRHAKALQDNLPSAKFFHLVRDGRDVVRSTMARNIFDNYWYSQPIKPVPCEPYYEHWDKMSKFEKCCWFWMNENRMLKNEIENMIFFEKLISDYDYFRSSLLEPIGIEIPESLWARKHNKPLNQTKKHEFPKWNHWDKEHTETYWKICGNLMEELGYSK